MSAQPAITGSRVFTVPAAGGAALKSTRFALNSQTLSGASAITLTNFYSPPDWDGLGLASLLSSGIITFDTAHAGDYIIGANVEVSTTATSGSLGAYIYLSDNTSYVASASAGGISPCTASGCQILASVSEILRVVNGTTVSVSVVPLDVSFPAGTSALGNAMLYFVKIA